MKKRIFAVLLIMMILLLPCGCAKTPAEQTGTEDGAGTKEQPEPLTVFIPGWTVISDKTAGLIFKAASERFTETYGIKVEPYPGPTYEESLGGGTMEVIELYRDKLFAAIMAGDGPDVFLANSGVYELFDDLYKKMDAGAFYDLNGFIENDSEFNMDEYEKLVMDTGIYKGSRYVLPLTYDVPTMYTSQEKLDRLGLTAEDFSTFERFTDSWGYIQQNHSNTRLSHSAMGGVNWGGLLMIYGGWFNGYVDYESGTTGFNQPSFELMMNLFRTENTLGEATLRGDTPFVEGVVLNDRLFAYLPRVESYPVNSAVYSIEADSLVTLPLPSPSGDIAASVSSQCMMSSTTKNPEMAWEFIKILLSEEVQQLQTGAPGTSYGAPVTSDLIDAYIEGKLLNRSFNERHLSEGYDFSRHAEVLAEKMKWYYHNYDNAFLGFAKSYLIIPMITDYIESEQPQDFDDLKSELENYFKIYLSE